MANDYGTDLAGVYDIPANFAAVTSKLNVAYAIARRLITPRGALIGDPDYGENIREDINMEYSERDLREREGRVRSECRKDERVNDADVQVTFVRSTGRMDVAIALDLNDGEEPFRFIIAIDKVTVALIREGQTFAVTPVTTAPSAQVIQVVGTAGPAGAPGAALGVSGGSGAVERLFDQNAEYEITDAAETFVAESAFLFTGKPASLRVEFAALAKVASGTAIFRIRIGGTPGGVDGTLVATLTTTSTAFAISVASGAYGNLGGTLLIKVTAQSPGSGVIAAIKSVTVNVKNI